MSNVYFVGFKCYLNYYISLTNFTEIVDTRDPAPFSPTPITRVAVFSPKATVKSNAIAIRRGIFYQVDIFLPEAT